MNRDMNRKKGLRTLPRSTIVNWHCPEIAQCSLSVESGSPPAMANIKSQLENGKCFSFTGSRSTDGAFFLLGRVRQLRLRPVPLGPQIFHRRLSDRDSLAVAAFEHRNLRSHLARVGA